MAQHQIRTILRGLFSETYKCIIHCRTCGGSSGGEACLLAADGSPFGIGSDLAGSLRIPATMCGIVSLKPTEG